MATRPLFLLSVVIVAGLCSLASTMEMESFIRVEMMTDSTSAMPLLDRFR